MANIYNTHNTHTNNHRNNHIIIEMNLDTYNQNTKSNIIITEEIREEILDRLIAITRMIFRYNCNPNQTYKNIVKDLINNEIEIDKVYKLFNLMLNDILIMNCPFIYKTINNYYSEIKTIILLNCCGSNLDSNSDSNINTEDTNDESNV